MRQQGSGTSVGRQPCDRRCATPSRGGRGRTVAAGAGAGVGRSRWSRRSRRWPRRCGTGRCCRRSPTSTRSSSATSCSPAATRSSARSSWAGSAPPGWRWSSSARPWSGPYLLAGQYAVLAHDPGRPRTARHGMRLAGGVGLRALLRGAGAAAPAVPRRPRGVPALAVGGPRLPRRAGPRHGRPDARRDRRRRLPRRRPQPARLWHLAQLPAAVRLVGVVRPRGAAGARQPAAARCAGRPAPSARSCSGWSLGGVALLVCFGGSFLLPDAVEDVVFGLTLLCIPLIGARRDRPPRAVRRRAGPVARDRPGAADRRRAGQLRRRGGSRRACSPPTGARRTSPSPSWPCSPRAAATRCRRGSTGCCTASGATRTPSSTASAAAWSSPPGRPTRSRRSCHELRSVLRLPYAGVVPADAAAAAGRGRRRRRTTWRCCRCRRSGRSWACCASGTARAARSSPPPERAALTDVGRRLRRAARGGLADPRPAAQPRAAGDGARGGAAAAAARPARRRRARARRAWPCSSTA